MTQTKFTPGPWSINEHEGKAICDVGLSIESDELFVAATYITGTDNSEEEYANARLIAAAPEMYELLTKILEGNIAYIENGSMFIDVDLLIKKIDTP